jgi:hypothetical protein
MLRLARIRHRQSHRQSHRQIALVSRGDGDRSCRGASTAAVATASIPDAVATIPAIPVAAPATVNVAPQAAPDCPRRRLRAWPYCHAVATRHRPRPRLSLARCSFTYAAAKSAPWLGLPPQNQAATAAKPEAAVATIPAASASGIATASGTQSLADGRAVAAQPAPTDPRPATPEQPTAGGSATPLAETKPQKPSATSSLLATLQKPFSLFSKPAAAKPTPSSDELRGQRIHANRCRSGRPD